MLIRRDTHHGLGGGWIFLIVIILLAILAFAAWTLYGRLRARRLGLPPPPLNPFSNRSNTRSTAPAYPAPAPGGLRGWLNDKLHAFKNRRYAEGAYEEPYSSSSGGGGGGGGIGGSTRGRGRGRGALDPDEAWDARVDNEAYYEEQELGLHAPAAAPAAYGGGGYGAPSSGFGPPSSGGAGAERGRSRTRDGEEHLRYDGDVGGARNPFGDEAASSLRTVSPHPAPERQVRTHQSKASMGSDGGSPTERRSMFRENM